MARRADKRQQAFIEDMRVLTEHWRQADPASFGVTEQQALALIEKYEAAAESLRQVENARSLARARTIENRKRMGALRTEFGALSEIIDGVAKSTGDKDVYARARIAKPDRRAPLPAPPPPSSFEHTLRNDGSIEVTFEIEDGGRGGLVYEVQRQLVPIDRLEGPDRAYEPLMVVAARHFRDDQVPQGLREVRYQVRALRSNGTRSDWAQGSTVFFGTQKSGSPTSETRADAGVAGEIGGPKPRSSKAGSTKAGATKAGVLTG